MRSYPHREWRPAKSHVVWRLNSAPTLAAASPAKPGCWALQLPAPGNSYLIEMQSRATASGHASSLESGRVGRHLRTAERRAWCDGRTFDIVHGVITGLAHAGVCVPDCEAAVAFYRDVLGLRVLSPPYVMAGDAIRDDMGELVSDPAVKAAIRGFADGGDRGLEVIENLNVDGNDARARAALTDHGLSHAGLICEDL